MTTITQAQRDSVAKFRADRLNILHQGWGEDRVAVVQLGLEKALLSTEEAQKYSRAQSIAAVRTICGLIGMPDINVIDADAILSGISGAPEFPDDKFATLAELAMSEQASDEEARAVQAAGSQFTPQMDAKWPNVMTARRSFLALYKEMPGSKAEFEAIVKKCAELMPMPDRKSAVNAIIQCAKIQGIDLNHGHADAIASEFGMVDWSDDELRELEADATNDLARRPD